MSRADIEYVTGSNDFDLPAFAADAVIVRGYGAYSLSTTAYTNTLPNYQGPINCASSLADPAYGAAKKVSDIVYLVQNDLRKSKVNRVILMVHWYSALTGAAVTPVLLGTEVTAPGVPAFSVGTYVVGTTPPLPLGTQIFPTISDASFLEGAAYLKAQGLAVGICPRHGFYDTAMYPVERAAKQWGSDQVFFSAFLANYTTFIKHYVDMAVAAHLNPWIFYIGYGMYDLTFGTSPAFFQQWVATLQSLAVYVKTAFPDTLVTYAADIDEYYVDYAGVNKFNLDAIWSSSSIDLVGINWSAPLSLTYTNDLNELRKGVLGGEQFKFRLLGYTPRATSSQDQLLTHSHESGKTGFAQTPLLDKEGYKNLGDFMSMGHYVAAAQGAVSSATPLLGNTLAGTRNSGPAIGTGITVSNLGLIHGAGGLAPIPEVGDTYLAFQVGERVFLTLPTFSGPTAFNLQFNFDVSDFGTALDYQLVFFDLSFGYALKVYYEGQNLKVSIPTTTVPLVVPITTAMLGSLELQITATTLTVLFDEGIVGTFTGAFTFPAPLQDVRLGSVFAGKIYFFSLSVTTPAGVFGGRYFFDEAYAGTRTAWVPDSKPFMATSVGYPSVSYGCADPSAALYTLLGATQGVFPLWFNDVNFYTGPGKLQQQPALFVTDIHGPYGSTYLIDDVHQALCLDAVFSELRKLGAKFCVAYYFDTRSEGALFTITPPPAHFIYSDALSFRYNQAINSKAAISFSGTDRVQALELPTVDERLGLSFTDRPRRPAMSILANPPPIEESIPNYVDPANPTLPLGPIADPGGFPLIPIGSPGVIPP